MIDTNSNRAEMRWDGHGRQSRWIFPSRTSPGVADAGDYEEYLYDANGNRTSLRKRDGSVLTFQYDALNRMTAKIVPERAGLTAAQTRDVFYDYDLRGLQTKARFDSLAGEGLSVQYDGFGRVSASTLAMAGASRTVALQYDRDGRRIELAFPDGTRFRFVRDTRGRCRSAPPRRDPPPRPSPRQPVTTGKTGTRHSRLARPGAAKALSRL